MQVKEVGKHWTDTGGPITENGQQGNRFKMDSRETDLKWIAGIQI